MTKSLNQIIFFHPPKSEYFFQQHWESEYFYFFFLNKNHTPPPWKLNGPSLRQGGILSADLYKNICESTASKTNKHRYRINSG